MSMLTATDIQPTAAMEQLAYDFSVYMENLVTQNPLFAIFAMSQPGFGGGEGFDDDCLPNDDLFGGDFDSDDFSDYEDYFGDSFDSADGSFGYFTF